MMVLFRRLDFRVLTRTLSVLGFTMTSLQSCEDNRSVSHVGLHRVPSLRDSEFILQRLPRTAVLGFTISPLKGAGVRWSATGSTI